MAFDVIRPAKFGVGEIGLTLTTFRTTPTLSRDIIKTIDIANNGASVAVVHVYLVPSGGSAEASQNKSMSSEPAFAISISGGMGSVRQI